MITGGEVVDYYFCRLLDSHPQQLLMHDLCYEMLHPLMLQPQPNLTPLLI